MTEDWPADDKRVPLSLAVPGWRGRLIPEVVEKVARGVAIEQERLRGSRFLVVLRWYEVLSRYELDYDRITEWVEIVSGHGDVESAAATAQIVGAQRLTEMERRLDPKSEWKRSTSKAVRWPRVWPTWEGKQLPGFTGGLLDLVGWNAVEVNVAIIPTEPDSPINLAVINAIEMMDETVMWFEGVVDGAQE